MKDLPRKAKLYIIPMILVGTVLTVWQLTSVNWQNLWLLALAGIAAVTQVLKVEGATEKSSYNISWLLYGFTFVLMGTPEALLVILIAHIVEWVWHKYPWYVQALNIASYALAISAAGMIYELINPGMVPLTLLGTIGILIAFVVFTYLNHLTIGLFIWLGRGQSFAKSGLFGLLTLMIDFTLMGLGAAMGMVWSVNPSAAILNVIPLYLIYRVLKVPLLQRQAEIDPKTKLFNARYFASALEKELDRAKRFHRPLTVVMGDLDLLRNINNSYGHLAGDVVLYEVAQILQKEFRGYDVVARFGGEEFAILMPEVTPEQALPRIEAVRAVIEAAEFEVSTSATLIKATMSFGIAGRNGNAHTADEIVHNADVALYSVKLSGRNNTRIYSNEGVVALFGVNESEEPNLVDIPNKERLEARQFPYQPNPLREKPGAKPPEPKTPPLAAKKPNPEWRVNLFIGFAALVAAGLVTLIFQPNPGLDWLGLAAFALLVALTEGLSVEIYIKETSISTSAAPFIAGVLLYGPFGALVLGVVLAGTAKIKHRSPMKNFIFNTSNHLISSSLCAGLILLTKAPITTQPAFIQVSLAVASGVIIYLSSTSLLSCVMSLSVGKPVQRIWKTQFRRLWPYYMAYGVLGYTLILGYSYAGLLGMLAILVPMLVLRYSQKLYRQHTEKMVNQLRENNLELAQQSKEITTLNEELLLSLANVIDLRDPYVFGHSDHVAAYATLIAEELGLTEDRVEMIRKAGLLHDIGKLGIPESILLKPGRLTADEYSMIKQHSALGAEMVSKIHSLQPLIPMIHHHHERYDGKGGYPDGLHGEDIPLEARIMSLVDAVDAMASDRPYRSALDTQEIFKVVRKNAGSQFDPMVVEAFFNIINKRGENLIVNSSLSVMTRDEPVFAGVQTI